MEIFAYHPDLKTWTEIGNSGMRGICLCCVCSPRPDTHHASTGIFRPEMLLPMGLPSNVRVIAWGLSLER